MISTYPWIIYTVLREMLTKILPSILVIILNIQMVKSYNRKTFQHSKRLLAQKDQNLMRLLFFLGVTFFVCNIPMAVIRILVSIGFTTEPIFKEFRIIINTIEVLFAASNFYCYCLCNVQIRQKVVDSWNA